MLERHSIKIKVQFTKEYMEVRMKQVIAGGKFNSMALKFVGIDNYPEQENNRKHYLDDYHLIKGMSP
jgi:hypothetical protein